MTSEIFSWGQAFLAQGTDHFLNKMLSIRKVRLLITSRYIAMQSYECVIISKMFLIYFISYGCNGGALVFLRGAEASASPSFALPMFITIKKIIILHLFLGVPAATVGGTGTPWHTRGYAPGPQPSKPEATAAMIQNSIGDRMEIKPWEKPGSVGGQFSSGQTSQQFVPTAAKSDRKGSTGSSGPIPIAV